jgi:hypothetical protein
MARRRRRAATATTTRIVRVGSPAPIVRISQPRAIRRRSHRRHSGGGRIGGSLISNESVQMAIGGALYGFAVKSQLIEKLPALPLLGRTGTAAILLDYFSRHGGGEMCKRASRAAAAIAGYQLGLDGTIQGDADSFVPNVQGDDMEGYDDE